MINLLLVGPAAERRVRHAAGGDRRRRRGRGLGAGAHGVWALALGPAGGSGVVSALILLNSLGAASSGRVPLDIPADGGLLALDEVQSILTRDGVSHAAHLAGALVGTAAERRDRRRAMPRRKRDRNRRVATRCGRGPPTGT